MRREIAWCAAALLTTGFAAGAPAETPGFNRLIVCPDVSGSLDPQEFDQSISALGAQLESIVAALDVQEVGFLPWAMPSDALRSPQIVAAISRPKAVSVPAAEDREHLGIYRRAVERAAQERATQMEAVRQEEESLFRSALSEALGPIRSALDGVEQGRAECTAVMAFVRRCLAEPSSTVSLILTDGLDENCGDPGAPTPEQGGNVVVILVPSANGGRDAVRLFEERRRSIEALSPRVIVIPASAVRTTSADWLLGALARERFPDTP